MKQVETQLLQVLPAKSKEHLIHLQEFLSSSYRFSLDCSCGNFWGIIMLYFKSYFSFNASAIHSFSSQSIWFLSFYQVLGGSYVCSLFFLSFSNSHSFESVNYLR